MSLAADIAVRVGAALALVAVNAAVASLLAESTLARAGLRTSLSQSGPRLLRPLLDAVKLLSKEDASRSAADGRLFRAAPVLVFAPSFLALFPLAFGGNVRLGSVETGLLFAYGSLALAPVGLLLAGVSADGLRDRVAAADDAVWRIACGTPLALSMLTPAIMAGGLEPSAVVNAQRGTWLFGLVPRWFALSPHAVAFGLFAVSAYLFTSRPLRAADGSGRGGTGAAAAYSGARFGLMSLADHTASFVVCALGVTVFLGGWLVPYIDRNPLAEALGPAVFLIKTYAAMYALERARAILPGMGAASLASLAWTRLVPVSLAWALAYPVLTRMAVL